MEKWMQVYKIPGELCVQCVGLWVMACELIVEEDKHHNQRLNLLLNWSLFDEFMFVKEVM